MGEMHGALYPFVTVFSAIGRVHTKKREGEFRTICVQAPDEAQDFSRTQFEVDVGILTFARNTAYLQNRIFFPGRGGFKTFAKM